MAGLRHPFHPLRAILALLALPVIGAVAALLIQAEFTSDWIEASRGINGPSNYWLDRGISTFGEACQHVPFRNAKPALCARSDQAGLLLLISITAGLLGALFAAAIWYVPYRCRGNRDRLARLFPTIWWSFYLVFVALFLFHAAIFWASGYLVAEIFLDGSSLAIDYGWPALIFLVILIVIGHGIAVFRSSVMGVVGREIDATNNRPIIAMVAEIAARMRAPMPEHVIVGLEPTFYVTRTVHLIEEDRLLTGRVLYLSLPLMRIISQKELAAIVAHELGHLAGNDLAFSDRFHSLFTRLVRMFHDMDEVDYTPVRWPTQAFLCHFLSQFSIAEAAVSRAAEFRADERAAESVGPWAAATSLAKVAAYSVLWQTVLEEDGEMLSAGRGLSNMSARFRRAVEAARGDELNDAFLEHVEEVELAHPTDSHPPLRDRLTAFGFDPRQVIREGLHMPHRPAAQLLNDLKTIEVSLTQLDQDIAVALASA